ncbi:MAG: 3-oxoacyl-ACP reductase FabG [Pseudomonadota bacterium]|nr:3-oxoacyl-ACP reductase FabG [Pseudomonadota bacterium]
MHLDLSSEIALVTGASRGIGQGIALALGHAGATVMGTATTSEGAAHIQELLTTQQIKGTGHVLDVTAAESIEALMAQLKSNMPTVLINNAGITRDSLLMRMTDDDWQAVIQTNLTAVYHLCKACLRAMLKARRGRIINLTSVVGLTGNAGQANYAAAKAGVIALSKSLAQEVGGRGITVNTLAPGFIETDMTHSLLEGEQRQQLLSRIPLNRIGQVGDIAQAAVFLASEAASYITGATLHVNGGLYMP